MESLTITMESFNSGIFPTPLIVSSGAEMIGSNDVKSKLQDSLEADSRCSSFFLLFYINIKQGVGTPLSIHFNVNFASVTCHICRNNIKHLEKRKHTYLEVIYLRMIVNSHNLLFLFFLKHIFSLFY